MKREEFMARVSQRLGRRSGAAEHVGTRAWIPPLEPRPPAELTAQFCAELAKIGGAAHVCSSTAELESSLIEFVRSSGARSLVAFAERTFETFEMSRAWRELPITPWERTAEHAAEDFRARVAAADIGLSIADLGVASTGSMLFCADAQRPRAVSLLPRSHIALLRTSDLVADLAEAFARFAERGAPPSSAVFVTGPSRTSDIENDLTLGVHGPAAVTVFLLQE